MTKEILTFTKYKREISRLLAEIVLEMIITDDWRSSKLTELVNLVNGHDLYRDRLKIEMDRKSPLTWPV